MKRLGTVDGEELILRKSGDVFKYYLNNKLIGVYDTNVMEDRILFREDSKENTLSAEIKDKVQNIVNKQNEEIFQEKEYRKEEVLELERQLGFSKKRNIKRITEIDLAQKVKINEEKTSKLERINNNILSKTENNNTINDVNVKQEMDLDNKTTDMKRLGQVLEAEGKIPKDGKKYKKLGIVESDEINKTKTEAGKTVKGNTTRYQFVLIDNEGNKTPIDLEQDYQEGDNPREENYSINANGKVGENSVLSRYKIGEGTLAIDNEQYGEIKAYYSPRKTIGGKGIEGNKSLDTELETTNVWETDKKIRDISGEYDTGYRSVEEGYQEVEKKHKTADKSHCDNLRTEDVDGKDNTNSHKHLSEDIIEKMAREILDENEEIADVYNMEDIKEKLLKTIEERKDAILKTEQLKKEVTEKAEKDSEFEHDQPGKNKIT